MSDERVKAALRVKDDPVRTGRSAGVDLVRRKDRELVPRACGREAEALVVVVLVRVATCEIYCEQSDLSRAGIPMLRGGGGWEFVSYLVRCRTCSWNKPQPGHRQYPLATQSQG